MVRSSIEYAGCLRTRVVHGPSGSVVVTDAPRDNHGLGEAFSPTDLLAPSLATCMVTVMGIAAQKRSLDIDGMTAEVDKHMSTEPPRKVARLVVRVSLVGGKADALDAEARAFLEDAGETCPVRLSLSETLTVDTSYAWGAPTPAPGVA